MPSDAFPPSVSRQPTLTPSRAAGPFPGFRPSARRSTAVPPWVGTVAILAVAAYLVSFAWAMENTSYDIWGAFLVGPPIVLVTVPMTLRLVQPDDDPRLRGTLVAALLLKLLAAVLLYAVSSEVYGGVADAFEYHDQGVTLAESFRRGDFVVDLPHGFGLVGTGAVYVLTGVVEAIIGPTKLGACLFFAWLSFWGTYLFYRAFSTAVPNGRRHRYAVLVFFLPSMLFWPSTIGKDAWMSLTVGLTAYGVARLLTHHLGGMLAIGAGLVGTALVRPHIALFAVASLTIAYLLRRSRQLSLLEPTKLLGVVVLVIGGLLVVGQVEKLLGIDRLDPKSAYEALGGTSARTSAFEGSQRDASPPSLLRLPGALVTVLFRPFPHEAHNGPALVASLEGVLLLLLFAASARSLLSLPRDSLKSPYIAFALLFTLLFAFAFSSLANFGLLARQRAQVFPLVLVLLAASQPTPSRRSPSNWAQVNAPASH